MRKECYRCRYKNICNDTKYNAFHYKKCYYQLPFDPKLGMTETQLKQELSDAQRLHVATEKAWLKSTLMNIIVIICILAIIAIAKHTTNAYNSPINFKYPIWCILLTIGALVIISLIMMIIDAIITITRKK